MLADSLKELRRQVEYTCLLAGGIIILCRHIGEQSLRYRLECQQGVRRRCGRGDDKSKVDEQESDVADFDRKSASLSKTRRAMMLSLSIDNLACGQLTFNLGRQTATIHHRKVKSSLSLTSR